MADTAKSVPDLTGRTAVITGANGGLGLQTTKVLSAKGAHLVMAVRNQTKAADALEQIRAQSPTPHLSWSSSISPPRSRCGMPPRASSPGTTPSTCW